MESTQIRNISIMHESDGKISQVLVNGEDIRNNIIGYTIIEWIFDPLRPNNFRISLQADSEKLFNDIFYAIDDLYSSNRGCLAAYLSSFLYETLTPLWRELMAQGKHIMAVQYWNAFISITHKWEKQYGKHIHKGTPYAFIAYTYLLIGDIDTGFSYIYNAIEEDIKLNTVCPRLNYPRNAPVYLTASLSPNSGNVMYPLVEEIRSELETYLSGYRIYFGRALTLSEFDEKFLQNIELDTIKYYFVFTFWTIFEYRRKVSISMMQNDFSRLKNANWMFALCLVIDKLLNSKYSTEYISNGIKEYTKDKRFMAETDLNSLRSHVNFKEEPDIVIPKLLPMNLHHNGSPVRKEIQCLFIAWNIRNYAGHNIQTQNVIASNFDDLLKILLYDIFLIIEDY